MPEHPTPGHPASGHPTPGHPAPGRPYDGGRVMLIDALRGVSVILMVIHHFLYDLMFFLGLPEWLFFNPVFMPLQYFFAGLFILISGVASRFSRGNVRRGLLVLAFALVISLVTWRMGNLICFGILHFLGFSMVFYGLTGRLWRALPGALLPVLCAALTVLSAPLASGVLTEHPGLWAFGLIRPDFISADYFPILPWIFVFLLGTWLGAPIRAGRFPAWFYAPRLPWAAAVGRRALAVYLLHQPILYGLTLLIGRLAGLP